MGRWSDSGSSERARHRLPVPLVRPRWWPRPGPRWRSGSASATRRIETWYLSVASGTMLRLVAHHPVDAPGRLSWPMGPPGPSPRLKVGDRVLGPQPPIRGPMRPARSWSPRCTRRLSPGRCPPPTAAGSSPPPPPTASGSRVPAGPRPRTRPPATACAAPPPGGCARMSHRPVSSPSFSRRRAEPDSCAAPALSHHHADLDLWAVVPGEEVSLNSNRTDFDADPKSID